MAATLAGFTEREFQELAESRVEEAIQKKRNLIHHVFRINPRPEKRVLEKLATDLDMRLQAVEDCFATMRQDSSFLQRKRKSLDSPDSVRKYRTLPLAKFSDSPSSPVSNSSSVATSRVPSMDCAEDMDKRLAVDEATADVERTATPIAQDDEDDNATLTVGLALIALKGQACNASVDQEPEVDCTPTLRATQATSPTRHLDGGALALATLERFGRVQVIMEADAPYRVVSVSQGWERLCGIPAAAVRGKTLSLIQGPLTACDAVAKLVGAASNKVSESVCLINYNQVGQPFEHVVYVDRLEDPNGVTKYLQATSLVVQAPGEYERPSKFGKDDELKLIFAKAHVLMIASREKYSRLGTLAGAVQVLPCHRDC